MASVVVVGAGVAGLTCAWRLQRAGHQVQVLEAEDAPGGRVATERRGEYVVECGASHLEVGRPNLELLVGVLGLRKRLRPLASHAGAIWDGRRLTVPALGWRGLLRGSRLGVEARLRLGRLRVELAARRSRLDPARPERAVALDREDAARWLRRLAGDPLLDAMLEPLLAARLDAAPESLSAAHAAIALHDLATTRPLASLEGGMGLLPEALADRSTVLTGCEAIRIETEEDGARIHYRTLRREGSLLADAVVVAVPGTRVPFVCPDLTASERSFFQGVRYGRGISVSLLLDKEPPNLPGWSLAVARRTGLGLRALEASHRRVGAAPRGTALVRVLLDQETSNRLWWAPDEALLECLDDALARTPIGRLAPRECVVRRWDPLLPRFEPGSLLRLRSFLARRERSPRLAFAGDYLVGPHLEGAVTSGLRAAGEIAAMLEERRPPQAGA